MRKITSIIIFAALLFILLPSRATAKVITMEKGAVEIAEDEVVDDDLFIAAETIDIEGTVNGDVYLGGESVRVNGNINGDLLVGTGTFYLSGNVRDDVYVGAGNVSLNKAVIGDSLIIGSGNVNIDEDSSIGGSLIAGSGTININAPIGRNVMVGAGTVSLNSSVGGEVRMGAGDITVGPDTKIAKDLYYTVGEDGQEIRMSDSASVSGMVKKIETNLADKKEFEAARTGVAGAFKSLKLFLNMISLFGAFVVGFLCLKLFPKTFNDSAALVQKSFLKTLGVGFAVTALSVPALFMLALTGIGLPLAGVLLLLLLLFIYLSKIVVSVTLGNWIKEKFGWKMSVYAVLALGLVLIYVLKMVYVVGFFLSLAVLWAGVGALVLHFKSLMTRL